MAHRLTDSTGLVDVVLLAGDRGPGDPLAAAAQVAGKTLVPVAGTPMLSRVLSTLATWGGSERIVLVAPKSTAYEKAAARGLTGADVELVWVQPAASLVASVRAGLAETGSRRRLLLTADHALLKESWLDALLVAAARDPASVLVGLADWERVMARFPGSRRTRYRFSDRSVCGTNLFALHADDGVERILQTWQQVEQERKKPWKIVSLLGWVNLGRYLAGRLSLSEAFATLSGRVGAVVHPVLMDDPLAAVDVDSPADLELVEQVLREKEAGSC